MRDGRPIVNARAAQARRNRETRDNLAIAVFGAPALVEEMATGGMVSREPGIGSRESIRELIS